METHLKKKIVRRPAWVAQWLSIDLGTGRSKLCPGSGDVPGGGVPRGGRAGGGRPPILSPHGCFSLTPPPFFSELILLYVFFKKTHPSARRSEGSEGLGTSRPVGGALGGPPCLWPPRGPLCVPGTPFSKSEPPRVWEVFGGDSGLPSPEGPSGTRSGDFRARMGVHRPAYD